METAVYKGYEGTAVTMTWADGTNWTLPGGFAWLLEPLQKQFAELGLPPFVIYHRSYVAFAPLEQSSETTAVR